MNNRIVIAGATGNIGQRLCKLLQEKGFTLTIFSRNRNKAEKIIPGAERYVEWNYRSAEIYDRELDGAKAVINLSGAPIDGKRWTDEYKKEIIESRVLTNKKLIESIKTAENKPDAFISASAVGIYGDKGDSELKEEAPAGDDFLAEVCKKWEDSALDAADIGLRCVCIRTGLVLDKDSGPLKKMLTPFKLFIGGPLGSGKQWTPWVHLDDIAGAYHYAVEDNYLNGPANASSPNPVRMKEFADMLGNVLGRPSIFKVPKFALKIAVGELAESVVASQRVQPARLINAGYLFKFPKLEGALKDLLN